MADFLSFSFIPVLARVNGHGWHEFLTVCVVCVNTLVIVFDSFLLPFIFRFRSLSHAPPAPLDPRGKQW